MPGALSAWRSKVSAIGTTTMYFAGAVSVNTPVSMGISRAESAVWISASTLIIF
nr:MAG TPA: hypothetical protein [Caudoviricetes sp.]